MSILVIVEHDNAVIAAATFNTLGAAQQIGGEIDVLVMGHGCALVSQAAAAIAGVAGCGAALRDQCGDRCRDVRAADLCR